MDSIICPKCGCLLYPNSYFDGYYCNSCGYYGTSAIVKTDINKAYSEKCAEYDKLVETNRRLVASNQRIKEAYKRIIERRRDK